MDHPDLIAFSFMEKSEKSEFALAFPHTQKHFNVKPAKWHERKTNTLISLWYKLWIQKLGFLNWLCCMFVLICKQKLIKKVLFGIKGHRLLTNSRIC